ncbi:MAG: DUF6151 family protein [Jhaorihella sp.]
MARRESTAALAFACDCGALRGHLEPQAAGSGTRVVCRCRDCRAAQLHLGQADPEPNGVDLLQTTPDTVTIDRGAQNLGLFRLGPRGLLRWYATCCNTPLFNTFSSPKLPFAGVLTARLADPDRAGPVRARGFVPKPGGTTHEHGARAVLGILGRLLRARLSGRWRNTPFFDIESGEPVVKPEVLTRSERAALYPAQRSTKG